MVATRPRRDVVLVVATRPRRRRRSPGGYGTRGTACPRWTWPRCLSADRTAPAGPVPNHRRLFDAKKIGADKYEFLQGFCRIGGEDARQARPVQAFRVRPGRTTLDGPSRPPTMTDDDDDGDVNDEMRLAATPVSHPDDIQYSQSAAARTSAARSRPKPRRPRCPRPSFKLAHHLLAGQVAPELARSCFGSRRSFFLR